MRVIILAAGMGTRLRPLTDDKPKSLVEVNGEPMIERQLRFLKEKGIEDIIIVTGYMAEKFEYLKGGKLSYKELENLPVMCLEGSTSTRKYVEDYLAERGTFVRPEFELATSDMLIQFAVRNLGVASVVSDFAEKYIENGELFVLKFDKAIPEREFCIVSNERAPMSAAAEKLYDFLLVP